MTLLELFEGFEKSNQTGDTAMRIGLAARYPALALTEAIQILELAFGDEDAGAVEAKLRAALNLQSARRKKEEPILS